MRVLFVVTLFLIHHFQTHGQDQSNKLRGFVMGNTSHEKHIIYFNKQWIMSFSGGTYKIYFEVDRNPSWKDTGYIQEFAIYRETSFGRKKVSFEVPYDSTKKYLIITRDPRRPKRHAFIGSWSDEEPKHSFEK
jgi:hypothetical protein